MKFFLSFRKTVCVLALLSIVASVNAGPWTLKAPFTGARTRAATFTIGTKGYISTGSNGSSWCKDLWEWDQSSNVWTQKADVGTFVRRDAVGFSAGGKGYIGTGHIGSVAMDDLWEWDPSSNTWAQVATLPGVVREGASSFAIGTKGYIGLGTDVAANVFQDFWEYNSVTNAWTQKANFGGSARAYAMSFAIGSKGYIGAGAGASGYKDFWEWDPAGGTWTQKADYGGGIASLGIGMAIGGKGYIGSGTNFWVWDPASNAWQQKTKMPGPGTVAAAPAFAIGNKGYVKASGSTLDFWEYDPDYDCFNLANFTCSEDTVLPGTTVNFAGPSFGVNSYNWMVNGVSFSTGANPAYTFSVSGTYT